MHPQPILGRHLLMVIGAALIAGPAAWTFTWVTMELWKLLHP